MRLPAITAIRQLGSELVLTGRSLAQRPGLPAAAVLCLTLGIGAHATMLGIVDSLLFRAPAHVDDPEAIQRLYFAHPRSGGRRSILPITSYPQFDALRELEAFQGLAATHRASLSLGRGARAEKARAAFVSRGFFRTLGASPLRGRLFAAEETRIDRPQPVALISHALWRSRLGGRETVLGEELWIGAGRYTVVGVLPEGFTGADLEPADIWLPLSAMTSQVLDPGWHRSLGHLQLTVFGRLAPGHTRDQAAAEATAVYRAMERRASGSPPSVELGPIQWSRGPRRSPSTRVSLWVAGMSLIVLLIATVNVANLLILRSLRRYGEFAVRLVLGARRRALVRLIALESLLLAVLGGLGALAVSSLGGPVVRRWILAGEVVAQGWLSGRLLGAQAGITVAVAGLCALIPSLWLGRRRLLSALQAGARGGGRVQARLRGALLVVQTALTLVLLVGSGLFVRSLLAVGRIDLGFDPDRVLVVDLDLERLGYEPPRSEQLLRLARERAEGLPGVRRAALGGSVPFRSSTGRMLIPSGRELSSLPTMGTYVHAVGAGYFETLGTSIRRGRGFTGEDERASGPAVIVVGETLARAYWPDGEALGQCAHVHSPEAPCATVIGVVEDVHRSQLQEAPTGQFYVPRSQAPEGVPTHRLFVRTEGPAAALAGPLRREIQRLDPALPYIDVEPLSAALDPRVRPFRLGAGVFTGLGLLALALAVIGLHGAIGHSVARRTHDLGVRLALGADRGDLLRLMVLRGLSVGATGVALGTGLVLLAAPAIEPLLFEVGPRDPLTLLAAGLLLLAATALASYLPGRQVRRIPAARALRVE